MRRFIRHPSGIPIEIRVAGVADAAQPADAGAPHALNVSQGGIALRFFHDLPVGSLVLLRIPSVRPVFESTARVVWCRPAAMGFEIGAEFLDARDEFRARMVEQVCQIENYRRRALREEHRELSADEAALEWIAQFAAAFPPAGTDEVS